MEQLGMQKRSRIRDYGAVVGRMQPGPLNKITDVKGVKVGHATIDTERHKTGVTVILPCEDNMFARKLTAAVYVHNGFGKTQGTIQIEELGTLEAPIALTNTLNIGRVHDALVGYMVSRCRADHVPMHSVNPVVGECNDATLNDIAERTVTEEDVQNAIQHACEDFEEGDVGAGKGTICFGLKGGIGSASRQLTLDGVTYTVGVLVQSNFGSTKNLTICGRNLGEEAARRVEERKLDEGSIMMVVATDLPVSDRQLKRIIKRAGVGLARCGSFMGHGSGDVMIGFTTANRIETAGDGSTVPLTILKEHKLEDAFTAAAEATEEAILNSLAAAHTVKGYSGTVKYALEDLFEREELRALITGGK
ncbi:MAG: P1 family peptidase [bacterium]|nr:P1 family peptidase [bacterium]